MSFFYVSRNCSIISGTSSVFIHIEIEDRDGQIGLLPEPQ